MGSIFITLLLNDNDNKVMWIVTTYVGKADNWWLFFLVLFFLWVNKLSSERVQYDQSIAADLGDFFFLYIYLFYKFWS